MSPYGPVIAGLAWLATLAAAFGFGCSRGADSVQAEWDAEKAVLLADHAEALADARTREHMMQADFDAAAAQWERDRADIETAAERLADDLRDGNARLHQRWQACAATASVSGAAGTAAGIDAGANDRAGSAARIIAAADRCDAQVRGLQALVRAGRAE